MTRLEEMKDLLEYCRTNKMAVSEVTVGDISLKINDVGLAMELTAPDDKVDVKKPKSFKEAYRKGNTE